ncbi:flagellin [Hellea sp.]|nr:flagellin [Hellea sp.]
MQLTGYPDLLSFTRRNRTTANIKARLDVAAQEAVTGQRADLTEATNGRVGNAHLLSKALNDIEQSSRINALSTTRLDMIGQGISGARNAMNGIDTRALIAINSAGTADVETIADEAKANLRSVMSALSSKQGTRNLFSGDAVDQSPFADVDILLDDIKNIMATAGSPANIESALDSYFDDPAGGFHTNIYTGGTDAAPPLQIGDGQKLNVDLRGDNDAIKDILRGLAVIATAESSGNAIGTSAFTEIFSSGITAAANGTSGLISLEGNLGIASETLEKANSRNQFEALSLNTAYQSLTGRDQFEAAAELKQLEVQLESSYIITSRLSDLSLTNYLR